MKFFKKSDRIRLLILLNAVFMGLILGIVNLRSSMLSEMQVQKFILELYLHYYNFQRQLQLEIVNVFIKL